jgi:hypothetical protein
MDAETNEKVSKTSAREGFDAEGISVTDNPITPFTACLNMKAEMGVQ